MVLKFRDKEKEIVFSEKEKAFTDTLTIADMFEKRHDHIMRLAKECIFELKEICDGEENFTLPTFGEREYKISQGNKYPYLQLDRDAFMYLMMKMKGKKANLYKLRFIHAFNAMEQWIKDRAVGRSVRLSMTESIKNYIPDTPNKRFKYKHFTDLVYKKVLGKSKLEIEKDLGVKIENLREICTSEQLRKFEDYENEISVLLKYGKTYSEIKEIIK